MQRFTRNASPVNRGRNGTPLNMNVSTVNRSCWIRRIFANLGEQITNTQVMDEMLKDGLRCSPSLISSVRRQLFPANPTKLKLAA